MLESTSMKDSLKLPRGATGVYITSTDPCYDSAKVRVCRGRVGRGTRGAVGLCKQP